MWNAKNLVLTKKRIYAIHYLQIKCIILKHDKRQGVILKFDVLNENLPS